MVILCSKNYQEMRIQLKSLGDVDYRTLLNNNTLALLDEFSLAYQGEQAYLKQAQEILMLLMKEFDRVCSKYGIQYYVICGSLIGVVRHHALIPWDDDIDIAMPREDYERLKKAAAAEWNNDEFSFVDYDQLGNGAFLDYMPRLFYNKATLPTKVYDKVQGKAKKQLQNRIFLDIYPMDNADDNEKKHLLVMNLMKGFYGLCMGHRAYVDYAEYERIGKNNLSWLRVAHTIGRCIPLKLLMAIYERLRRYANRKECENYYMATCAITCIERRFRKEFFGEGKRMKMGELEVTVPSDYDGLMKAMGYGNYMELPPLSIRKPSHYFNSDIVIW
jgi:lipopolysaccharide cholinephosphotransferase